MAASSFRVVSMSRTCGMFSRMTGESVSRAAAMQGSAAFFAPLMRTVPRSGSPPRITNLSMNESLHGYCSGECASQVLTGRARENESTTEDTEDTEEIFVSRLCLRQCYSVANMTVRFLQSGNGLGSAYARGQHHDRDWGSIAAGCESVAGGVVIGSSRLFQDADRALDEFLVLGPDVDHEVAVDVAEARHGPGRDHIQNHFVGRACFH